MEHFSNVVRPFGYSSMECGYCKGKRASIVSKTPQDCSKSFGMLAESMTPETYEAFLYRGWRRSGIHLYKPSNFESCCPTMTMRLLVEQFRPTKSQSKIQRKLQKLLQPGHDNHDRNRKKNAPAEKDKSKGNPIAGRFESYFRETTTTARILDALETATRQGLIQSKIVSDHSTIIPTISYKVRPPPKPQEKQRQLILASSVCAQVAGKAKLPNRDALLDYVVAYLQNQPFPQSSDGSIRCQSIEGHSKSGQILVTVECSASAWEQASQFCPSDMALDGDASMRGADDDEDKDKLAHWYQTTTGKPLKPHQRTLRIETIPAHQSALNPQVHELYVRYQHVVHQDPDPLHVADENDTMNDDGDHSGSSIVEKTKTADMTETSINAGSPDPTEATHNTPLPSSNDHASKLASTTKPLPDPLEAIERLDWGPHHPSNFREQVTPMLRNYLAPYSKSVQRALLNNYFSFYQFLVESPFDGNLQQKTNNNGDLCGAYHQQYWIGDVLIAVGVVDILPRGLSSVYLYYQPELAHQLVALGKLAILKEIEYTKTILRKPFYYLGYYIESCQKMRYKADYQPSQLLCPVYYQWVDCAVALPKLQNTMPKGMNGSIP
jgi:arginyl-tRNA--protein-N-Asp/Glu arginylyltransferase